MICLQKSLRFLNNRIFILEMFNISPAAAQHCVLCKNRHEFVTEGFVQIIINIYYMQFIYRQMLTHMAVKWWIRLASILLIRFASILLIRLASILLIRLACILLIRLACIHHDIMNVPIMKTHSPTYSQRDRERKKEWMNEWKKERTNEWMKVHSQPITGVLLYVLPGNFIHHNQSANLYHRCQETVTNSNIRRYYDFKVEG